MTSTDHRNTPSTSSLRKKNTCSRCGWVEEVGELNLEVGLILDETCSETVQTSHTHTQKYTHKNMYIIYTLHFNSFLAFVVDILTLCICVISD